MKPHETTLKGLLAGLVALTLLTAQIGFARAETGAGDQTDSGQEETDVSLDWGVEIPVSDGTVLNGTLYRPNGSEGRKLPTIVTITPYISDRYHPDALYFARNGFAFLIVDTRGRGNSQGEFRPLGIEDGSDGRDVIEWIARQAWSNGQIGLRGGSYGGYNQWATARYFPEHLSTIVPIASPHHGADFPMNYNVQYAYTIRWLTLTAGVTPQGRMFGDDAFWNRKFREYHTSGIAFDQLDQLVGNPSLQFQEWVDHPMYDDHWAAFVPTVEDYQRFELPILTITGYYDGDQPGAMEYYRRHMRYGTESGKANHYLILGPWDHSGTRMPRQEFGGLEFGDAMMFDAFALDRDWYWWTMAEGERPEFILDRVTYFVAGGNQWKGAPSLEAISDEALVLHLQSLGDADSLFHSGTLGDSPLDSDADDVDVFVYDPLDTRKAKLDPAEDYIIDQVELVMTDGDGLIYHSEPFEEATEITGYPRFETWLEMDVPDTDINVTLYEVLPDGSSIALTGETQRARYRSSLSEATMMTPGKVEPFVFERFYFFSRLIGEGSRLRLFIRPANLVSNQRNYNAGLEVARETSADARTATVKLHMGPDTPSRLILPLVR
jgi:putative CocE/NonD family hydrolase